ncbi:MAG: hypothetical protein R2813_08705 [Flavobacteriales bacterium]
MLQVFLFNLIDRLSECNLLDYHSTKTTKASLLGTTLLEDNLLWILDFLKFSQMEIHILKSLSHALSIEDYDSAHHLKKEFDSICSLDDKKLFHQGYRLLFDFNDSFENSPLLVGLKPRIVEIMSAWFRNEDEELDSILSTVDFVVFRINQIDEEDVDVEVIEAIMEDRRHPLEYIDSARFYFGLLNDQSG